MPNICALCELPSFVAPLFTSKERFGLKVSREALLVDTDFRRNVVVMPCAARFAPEVSRLESLYLAVLAAYKVP